MRSAINIPGTTTSGGGGAAPTPTVDDRFNQLIVNQAGDDYEFHNVPRVNVKWFGAVGDGVTDDTQAIQDAFDFYQKDVIVEFPPGDYSVSSSILVDIDKNRGIEGNNAKIIPSIDIDVFKLLGNISDGTNPNRYDDASGLSVIFEELNFFVKDLIITTDLDHSTNSMHSRAFVCDGTFGARFQGVHINRMRDGIQFIGNNRNPIISDCHIYTIEGTAFHWAPSSNMHQFIIHGCHISFFRKCFHFDNCEIANGYICNNDIEPSQQYPDVVEDILDAEGMIWFKELNIVGNGFEDHHGCINHLFRFRSSNISESRTNESIMVNIVSNHFGNAGTGTIKIQSGELYEFVINGNFSTRSNGYFVDVDVDYSPPELEISGNIIKSPGLLKATALNSQDETYMAATVISNNLCKFDVNGDLAGASPILLENINPAETSIQGNTFGLINEGASGASFFTSFIKANTGIDSLYRTHISNNTFRGRDVINKIAEISSADIDSMIIKNNIATNFATVDPYDQLPATVAGNIIIGDNITSSPPDLEGTGGGTTVEATYTTDFSEYTTGQQPSDWTQRWAAPGTGWEVQDNVDAEGGKMLHFTPDAADGGRMALSWDAIDAETNRDNVEILMKIRGTQGSDHSDPRAMIRGSGSAGNEIGYAHGQRYNSVASGRLRAFKYTPGGTTIDFADVVPANDVWAYVRIRVVDDSIQIRQWEEGNSEPSSWDIEATDSEITGAGWVGITTLGGAGAYYDIDTFKVDILQTS